MKKLLFLLFIAVQLPLQTHPQPLPVGRVEDSSEAKQIQQGNDSPPYREGLEVGPLFKAMPDSLLPYLTTNNRLDMLDFMEVKMKAEVTKLLEGKSEMTALTSDSLSIRMSDVLRIDMKVVSVPEPVDSSTQVIRVVRTYQLNDKQSERVVDVYSTSWRRLSSVVEQSSLLRRDEELLTK